MYDEKHKALRFPHLAPEADSKIQQGLKERLLCEQCEQLFNDRYEKPFKELWYGSGSMPKALAPLGHSVALIIPVQDFERFTLFHLSVLFRASVARRGEFSEVEVGPKHLNRLRKLLLGEASLADGEYPIVSTAVEGHDSTGVLHDLVSSPDPFRLDGHRGYCFTFAGCSWMYLVTSHDCRAISDVALRRLPGGMGELPVAKLPWQSMLRRWAPAYRAKLTRAIRGVSTGE